MTFLNATLLLGALAAAVPIVLHWLSRQEPKRVVLPSVRFLAQRLTTQQSNLRVRRWWLLAMRMLAILAVAGLLARPMIASSAAVTWGWIGGLALVAVAVLVLASVAWVRGLGRWLAGVLAGVAVLLLVGSVLWAATTWATADTPPLAGGRPLAIAIVVDNSPSAARRSIAGSDQPGGRADAAVPTARSPLPEVSGEPSGGSERRGGLGPSDDRADDGVVAGGLPPVSGTRLAKILQRAEMLIDRLPAGSRVAVIDRTNAPVAFSLDAASAKQRLSGLQVTAVPASMRQRLDAAAELVRSSDLPDRQVVVISDLCAAAWRSLSPGEETGPPTATWFGRRFGLPARSTASPEVPTDESTDAQPLATAPSAQNQLAGQADVADRPVGLTVLGIVDVADGRSDSRLNRWLSPPRWIDATPPPGVSIPIVCSVNVQGGSDAADVSGTAFNLTAQLKLYESDPRYPVIRDGRVVRPPLRLVDRASVSIGSVAVDETTSAGQSEVVLTLPPLDRGTAHAVIELIGEDGFAWDDRRYLTLALPPPPRVLIVADQIEEANVLAAAMTAPQPIDDPAAGYRVDRVGYEDLAAVRFDDYRAVVLADPPLAVGTSVGGRDSPEDGQTVWTPEQIREVSRFVDQGGGLWVLLGPNLVGGGRLDEQVGQDEPIDWLPPVVRPWRSPAPGTFLQTVSGSHPSLRGMEQLSQPPAWSEFRVHRYWQVRPRPAEDAAEATNGDSAGEVTRPDDWQVVMQYAGAGHPALVVRGRVAVATTPLPALGKTTRAWNELFSGADAWPAFVMVRSVTAWLTGVTDQQLTLLAGRTAVLQPIVAASKTPAGDADPQETIDRELNDPEAVNRLQLFPPGDAVPESVVWDAGPEPTTTGQRPVEDATMMVAQTDLPGTYFLRGAGVWSGYSVNLDPIWSSSRRLQQSDLTAWIGSEGWQWTEDVSTMELGGVGGGESSVSVHGPLTWLAVAVFLLEQLLSNRFYGRGHGESA